MEAISKQPALSFVEADKFVQDNLTVLIFTSPVPSHPSTWLLERVYSSIRRHLPGARIVILADGKAGDEPKEYVEFKDNVRQLGWELKGDWVDKAKEFLHGTSRGFFGSLELHHGVNLLPTICFQGPMHIANSDWYRQLTSFFSEPQNLEGSHLTFFLTGGSSVSNNLVNGLQATNGIRQMACYIPPGPMGRLYHLDGRNVVNPNQVESIGKD